MGLVRLAKPACLVTLPLLLAIATPPRTWPWHPSSLAYAAPTRAAKGKQVRKDFAYTVSDCLGPDKNDGVALELSEGTVKFSQILTMNCIAATHPNTVKVAYAKKGHDLVVTIILKSELQSDCTCPVEIDGTIAALAKGDYRLAFAFDSKLGRSVDEKATEKILGSKEFSVE